MSKEPKIREQLKVSMGAALVLGPALPFALIGQDVNVLLVVLVVAFLVISLGIHEAAHAWVALQCGDTTARDLGRITLNPIPHIDLMWTIVIPTFLMMTSGYVFGGAKPVPVNYYRLRNPLRDMMLVAIAGPASNFLLAIVFALALKVAGLAGYEPGQLMFQVLALAATYNILLMVFNLIPVPPLDGSRVMAWLLPESLRSSYVQLERFGMLIVLFLVFGFPPFKRILFGAMGSVQRLVQTITGVEW